MLSNVLLIYLATKKTYKKAKAKILSNTNLIISLEEEVRIISK